LEPHVWTPFARRSTLVATEQPPLTPVEATWSRLEEQLAWYSRQASVSRRAYRGVKAGQLVVAATIPVIAAAGVTSAVVTASLGAAVLLLEGVQQLGRYHENWLNYRGTAEALKSERALFLGRAGPYTDPATRDRALAERVESLIVSEYAAWSAAQEKAERGAAVHSPT